MSELRKNKFLSGLRVLEIAVITFFICWVMTLTLLPLFLRDLGASTLEVGFIISVTSWTSMILQIPMGRISDKIDKWFIIGLTLGLQSMSYFLYSVVPGVIWLYPIVIFKASIGSLF